MNHLTLADLLSEWKTSDIEKYIFNGWKTSFEKEIKEKESTVIKLKKGDKINLEHHAEEISNETNDFDNLIAKMFKHRM